MRRRAGVARVLASQRLWVRAFVVLNFSPRIRRARFRTLGAAGRQKGGAARRHTCGAGVPRRGVVAL